MTICCCMCGAGRKGLPGAGFMRWCRRAIRWRSVRRAACAVDDFFVDVPYQGEVVRARWMAGELKLHEGGDHYLTLPPAEFTPEQISPTRDTRLRWMQSVLRCTHYIAGAGEQAYLRKADAPEITFVNRDPIDRSDEAYC